MKMTDSTFYNQSYELYPGRPRSAIPVLPKVSEDVQLCIGDWGLGLAYLALQVRESDNKKTIVRAIASAVSIIFDETGNILGAPNLPSKFVGLVEAAAQTFPDGVPDTISGVGFDDAVDISQAELREIASSETEELAGVFAMYVQAAGKRPNAKNIAAFDTNRADAIKSTCNELALFGHSSDLLSLPVLQKVASSLNAYANYRACLISAIAGRIDKPWGGPPHTFKMMFVLLVDAGIGALRLIKIAVARWPWLRTDFPELAPELNAAQAGIEMIRRFPAPDRSFCKALYGDAFVPVNPQDIQNVFGVCKYTLSKVTPTYENYGGGIVTPSQKAYIDQKLQSADSQRGDVTHAAPSS